MKPNEQFQLLELWDEYLPSMFTDPHFAEMTRLRNLAITLVDVPAIEQRLRSLQLEHEDRVRRAVERGRAEGAIRPDVDDQYVAWMWTGLMLACSYRESLDDGGFAQMLPFARRFIDSLRS